MVMMIEEAPDYVEVKWEAVEEWKRGHCFVGDLEITEMPLIIYDPEWTDWGPGEEHDPRVKKKLIGFRLKPYAKRLRYAPILLNFGSYGAIVFSNWKYP